MRISLLFCALALILLSGCAGQDRGITAESEPAWPWRIHCETQETYALDLLAVPGVYHGRWIWGLDNAGGEISLSGQLEDGFFHLKGVHSASGEILSGSQSALRKTCIDTLARLGKVEPNQLGRVRAARHSADIDVPILFSDDEAGRSEVSRLVIFGDSLSDAGRLKHRMQIFPGEPYWLGRFSNGPVWTDYLEASTALSIRNDSFGGASVARPDHLYEGGLLAFIREGGRYFVSGSIALQVDDYIEQELLSGNVINPEHTAYVVWAGANDYISKEPITGVITTFLNSPRDEFGYKSVADQTIAGIVEQLNVLYGIGARKFLVMNMPDLGRTPIVLQNETYASKIASTSDRGRRLELSRRLTALSDYHDRKLAEAINLLSVKWPDASVMLVDSRALIDSILTGRYFLDESKEFDYGFSLQALQEELAHEDAKIIIQKPCFTGHYMGTTGPDNTCEVSDTAFFWDVVHPSSYAHCWQAYQIGHVLAGEGWIRPMPEPAAYREWCKTEGTPYPSDSEGG